MATLFAKVETVLGMEVHAELLTQSKMFCGCSTQFGAPPNSQCCPVCLGLPGSLPVPNRAAVEHVLRTALALNCRINWRSIFHRKNYFYPDLPKAYQISQYDVPIGVDGYLDVRLDGEVKRIRIRRVHLEEDTGKLFHIEAATSFVDYNRSGVPLMEVVSEPDIYSAEEARAYLRALRLVLVWIGASDGKMEQGSLRCEPNISIRPAGTTELGTKVELKNLNSFQSVYQGVAYEVERQTQALARGEELVQETRRWDEERLITAPMRTKEYAHDYRYFPEPDLVPLEFDAPWIERLRAGLPELPEARYARYVRDYGLSEYEASLLIERDQPQVSDFFDAALRAYGGDPKRVSNWMQSDFLRLFNAAGEDWPAVKVRPEHLAAMLKLQDKGQISGKIAKEVFEVMWTTGKPPEQIVQERGLQVIGTEEDLAPIIDQVLAQHPAVVESIRKGEEGKFNFLVGQVMRATRGKADPGLVNRMLRERIAG
ncbi:MAG: Asp-tRNA(Asn)/Glu-tRNA(Gln) amidotransferase subunit GatB [Armatimonadetes bacterium]|nr:Asp-tRNA(Asn)/Glu-tRNA(Gln) amidotransferase subunit GatB [Armatimonadota bacterium]